uniref:Uncharacterized protein n=1 Tax=Macrostomum lignano TaxID=282301 RepID=A0A1I8F6I6_9PLAT
MMASRTTKTKKVIIALNCCTGPRCSAPPLSPPALWPSPTCCTSAPLPAD